MWVGINVLVVRDLFGLSVCLSVLLIVERQNLLIHEPLQLFLALRILPADVSLRIIKVKEFSWERLGRGLVFRVMVCVEVGVFEALFNGDALPGIDCINVSFALHPVSERIPG